MKTFKELRESTIPSCTPTEVDANIINNIVKFAQQISGSFQPDMIQLINKIETELNKFGLTLGDVDVDTPFEDTGTDDYIVQFYSTKDPVKNMFLTLSWRKISGKQFEYSQEGSKLVHDVHLIVNITDPEDIDDILNSEDSDDEMTFVHINEETDSLDEATIKTKEYSWGKMKTIQHGSDWSIPLHPEHQEAIASLEDEEEHKFKDETGSKWTAKRLGDTIHFTGGDRGTYYGGNYKTSVLRKHLTEETDSLDEEAGIGRRIVHRVENGNKKAVVYKRYETGEHEVEFHRDGKKVKDGTYFTDDVDDAKMTANHFVGKLEESKDEIGWDRSKSKLFGPKGKYEVAFVHPKTDEEVTKTLKANNTKHAKDQIRKKHGDNVQIINARLLEEAVDYNFDVSLTATHADTDKELQHQTTVRAKNEDDAFLKAKSEMLKKYPKATYIANIHRPSGSAVNEEQLDEISKETLTNYIQSAAKDAVRKGRESFGDGVSSQRARGSDSEFWRKSSIRNSKKADNRLKGINQAAEKMYKLAESSDETDTIKINVPAFIRCLEHAMEDVKEDAELHEFVENLLEISKTKDTITTDDYEKAVSDHDQEEKDEMNESKIVHNDKVIGNIEKERNLVWKKPTNGRRYSTKQVYKTEYKAVHDSTGRVFKSENKDDVLNKIKQYHDQEEKAEVNESANKPFKTLVDNVGRDIKKGHQSDMYDHLLDLHDDHVPPEHPAHKHIVKALDHYEKGEEAFDYGKESKFDYHREQMTKHATKAYNILKADKMNKD